MKGTRAIRLWAGRLAFGVTVSVLAVLGVTAGSTAATDTKVAIVYRAYQPAALTIGTGQTVTWTNSGLGPHTVTAVAGQFDSGRLDAGASFSYTFSAPGTYLYSCLIHPTMKGEVVVLAATAGAGAPLVPPVGQSVKLHLSRQHGPHGGLTLVHVQAPRPGARAFLQLRFGPRWSTSRQARLGPGGRVTFRLSASIHRRLRVIVPAAGGKPRLLSRTLQAGG